MMDFEEFAQELKGILPDYLLAYEVDKILIEDVVKNNGEKWKGIVIALKGENISPNIYLDYYYNRYMNGSSMDEIAVLLVKEFGNALERITVAKLPDMYNNFEKDKIFLKLINMEKNQEMLKNAPYIPLLNLAISFRYLTSLNETDISSALITENELLKWGLSNEELFKLAKENTHKLFPPRLERLSELLKESMGEERFIPEVNLFVLTNSMGINGACYMFDKEILNKLCEEYNSNVYILPSSIHEVLLLPDSGEYTCEALKEMVYDVNRCAVPEIDYLSDSVYYYDREKGLTEI